MFEQFCFETDSTKITISTIQLIFNEMCRAHISDCNGISLADDASTGALLYALDNAVVERSENSEEAAL
jgi:hypothetical protein